MWLCLWPEITIFLEIRVELPRSAVRQRKLNNLSLSLSQTFCQNVCSTAGNVITIFPVYAVINSESAVNEIHLSTVFSSANIIVKLTSGASVAGEYVTLCLYYFGWKSNNCINKTSVSILYEHVICLFSKLNIIVILLYLHKLRIWMRVKYRPNGSLETTRMVASVNREIQECKINSPI